ncbi:MAG: hypothetical protein JOZ05_09130 [Acetobacteraceae bacterium]|nr:hypothetical protein [Acetobacteraceae bacterium]
MNADHAYLEGVSHDKFGALLFELASQLHVERQRRIALETALQRAGVLAPGTLDAMANEPAVLEQGRSALDQALRRLMRIMTETGEPRGPLRDEASE